MPSVFLQHA